MRHGEGEGERPPEEDWLAEEWLDAPTEETPPSAPRRRFGPPPPGAPSRRLLALVAGVSIVVLIILVAVLQGDGEEEAAPTTTPTETAPAPQPETEPTLTVAESGTLAEGDSGRRVRRLQRALAGLGYDVSPDGAFGPGTTAAVRAFQEDAGLQADGVVGPETARALNEALTDAE